MATATATTSRTSTRTPATVQVDPAISTAVKARRALREKERRERQKELRRRAIMNLLYRFICWVELLPRRIAESTATFVAGAIVVMLLAACFFAAMGILEMALSFWASFIPGW